MTNNSEDTSARRSKPAPRASGENMMQVAAFISELLGNAIVMPAGVIPDPKVLGHHLKRPINVPWREINRPLIAPSDILRWRDYRQENGPVWPCNAFAVRLDELAVVDVDDPDLYADLDAKGLLPCDSLIVRSVSGGSHIYFSGDFGSVPVPCRRSLKGRWDLKSGAGHVIIGPGSYGYHVVQPGETLADVAQAAPILQALAEIAPALEPPLPLSASSKKRNREWKSDELRDVLAAIDPDELSYDRWCAVTMAVHHANPSEEARLVVDEWSQRRGEEHTNRSMPEAKWASFAGGPSSGAPVTMGTVVSMAKADGWQPPAPQQPSAPTLPSHPEGHCAWCGTALNNRVHRWCDNRTCKLEWKAQERVVQRHLNTQAELRHISARSEAQSADPRTRIVITARTEEVINSEAREALVDHAASTGLPLFRQAVGPVFRLVSPASPQDIADAPKRITRWSVIAVSKTRLRELIDSACLFVAEIEGPDGTIHEQPRSLPSHVVEVLHEQPPRVAVIDGVLSHPYVWRGELITKPGYDLLTRIWHAEHPVPAHTNMTIAQALDTLLNGLLLEVPFRPADDGTMPGVAAALARLLFPVLRTNPGNRGVLQVPMTLWLKADSQVGATTSAKLVAQTSSGVAPLAMPLTDNEELRKKITSAVLGSPDATILFDNLPQGGTVDHPALATLITSDTWADRVLGLNQIVNMENRLIVDGTGINPNLSNETVTRILPIWLEATETNPTNKRWKQDHRELSADIDDKPDFRSAVLSLVARWIEAGCPASPDRHTWSTFQGLVDLVCDVLQHAGISGFGADRKTITASDESTGRWTEFLGRWQVAQEQNQVAHATAGSLVNALIDETADPPRLSPVRMPGTAGGNAQALGRGLRKIEDRWFRLAEGTSVRPRSRPSGNARVWHLDIRFDGPSEAERSERPERSHPEDRLPTNSTFVAEPHNENKLFEQRGRSSPILPTFPTGAQPRPAAVTPTAATDPTEATSWKRCTSARNAPPGLCPLSGRYVAQCRCEVCAEAVKEM